MKIKMKKFQVNSIIRAAALYHLYYDGYFNQSDKNIADMADDFSFIGTDRKEFLNVCDDYNKNISLITKQTSAKIEKSIKKNIKTDNLTPNKLIFIVAFYLRNKPALTAA